MAATNKVRRFKSLDLVLEYLQQRGYVVSRPTLFRHRKAGKLLESADGTFLESSIVGYADAFLTRNLIDGESVDVSRVAEEKLVSDARRAKALARIAESKAKELDSAFIPRGDFERELARRALWLKSDLQNFMYQLVPGLCSILEGNQGHVPEGIQHAIQGLDSYLGRYAEQGQKVFMSEGKQNAK